MADGIDAMAHRVQSPGRDPMLDRVLPKSESDKLPPGDNPMLPPRHLPDPAVPTRLPALLPPRPREIAYTTMCCGLGGARGGHWWS